MQTSKKSVGFSSRVVLRFMAHSIYKGTWAPPVSRNTICYPKGCAATSDVRGQCNTRGSLSKLKRTPPQRKINVTSNSPVGEISVVTLIRTDTTLDHSQKAEKVCSSTGCQGGCQAHLKMKGWFCSSLRSAKANQAATSHSEALRSTLHQPRSGSFGSFLNCTMSTSSSWLLVEQDCRM